MTRSIEVRRGQPVRGVGSGDRGRVQGRVLLQQRLLGGAEAGARGDPQLLDEDVARPADRRQRVPLTTAAVERDGEHRPEVLTQRLLEHHPLELRDGLAVPTEGELGLEQCADGVAPDALEAAALGLGEGGVRPVGVRLAPPEVEGLGERRPRSGGVSRGEHRATTGAQVAELQDVELGPCGAQDVPVLAQGDEPSGRAAGPPRLQRAAEPDDVRLQRLAGSRGCVAVPQLVDEAVDGDGGRVGGDEHGEQPSFLGPRDRREARPRRREPPATLGRRTS